MTTTSRPLLTCKRCGADRVHWATRKDGSYYLAVILPATPDHPRPLAIKRPHVCPSPEQIARYEEADRKNMEIIWRGIRNEEHRRGEHTVPVEECTLCELDAIRQAAR